MSVSALADGDFLTSAIWETVREQVAWSCTSSTRPTGVNGRVISETDTGRLARYDGSAWQYIDVTAWESYTPAWSGLTVGNGTYSGCAFRYVGDAIEVQGSFTLGTTSAVTGTLAQTVPDSASISFPAFVQAGLVSFVDTGTQAYWGSALPQSSTSVGFQVANSGGTYVAPAATSSTVPFTWTTSDAISWHYTARLT